MRDALLAVPGIAAVLSVLGSCHLVRAVPCQPEAGHLACAGQPAYLGGLCRQRAGVDLRGRVHRAVVDDPCRGLGTGCYVLCRRGEAAPRVRVERTLLHRLLRAYVCSRSCSELRRVWVCQLCLSLRSGRCAPRVVRSCVGWGCGRRRRRRLDEVWVSRTTKAIELARRCVPRAGGCGLRGLYRVAHAADGCVACILDEVSDGHVFSFMPLLC